MKKILYLLIFLPLFSNAQVKISELTGATSVSDADLFILNQGGTTKKVAFSVFDYGASEVASQVSDSLVNYTTLDSLSSYLLATQIRTEISDSLSGYAAPAAGSTGQIQFNTAGVLDASDNFSWNDTTLTIKNNVNDIFIGLNSGSATSIGGDNIVIGDNAGVDLAAGDNNIFIGFNSGFKAAGSYENIFLGKRSGYNAINTTVNNNIFMGTLSGESSTGGANNVFIGASSGRFNLTGSNNIFIGKQSGESETGSNKLYIENSNADSTNALIFGNFATNKVRINGTLSVSEKIILDTTIQTYQAGMLYYDEHLKAPTFYNDIADFKHQLGYEMVARYYNSTGVTIANGTLITPVGQKINGAIIPTVQLAGNLSADSLKLIGISTTTTLAGDYGIVTLVGPVNGLDLSAFSDNDLIYAGHAGQLTNVKPEPPSYAMLIGKVFYADNDSGQLYMFPEGYSFDPAPHVVGDTSGVASVVTVTTQNVYYKMPVSLAQVRENHGFTVQGDSISPMVDGHYNISLDFSFGGNPTAEVWNYGIFINGVRQFRKTRSTSSSAYGDAKVSTLRYLNAGDWISFKIRNTSGTGDPTVSDIGYFINYVHE